MVLLTEDPLNPAEIEAHVAAKDCGAILSFVGSARCTPAFGEKEVTGLFYEAYAPMARAEMEKIRTEAQQQWPHTRIAIVHRLGHVQIGEAAVVVAVASPHRAAAYEASRYAIEQLKARVPIWKRESYHDGSAWTANRP